MSCQVGEVLGDRFLYKGSRIFLDTQPGLLSANSAEVPTAFVPYLRLSPLRLHVPQVYDWLSVVDSEGNRTLLLLDHAPLWVTPDPADETEIRIQLFPALLQEWQQATPLRQLNWLWQMANLWQPLSSEQVVSSLLDPDLLRVEGSILHLLELRSDERASALALGNLGEFWLQWTETARPEIADRLRQLCHQLIDGQIHNAEILVEQLDEAIAEVAQAQTSQIQLATLTDQGPSRSRNEDACYPASGTVEKDSQFPLVIVCDGIGGHQGGDVASHLAIETVEQRVKALQPKMLDSITLTVELEKAVCAANDQISQRNDSEQRYERQRMGTTIVMGLLRDHELYVTHVGDSRAYWVTRYGCRQITLDDDVASREVRLGYSAYRQALQQPSAGSLVQALGMGASNLLYPTVQRFILDEDSVFIFCSDGLSDNDRIETAWDSEILPLLESKTDLASVAARLIEIANTLNGYDNATVGLLHYRVKAARPAPTLPLAEAVPQTSVSETQRTILAAAVSPQSPAVLPDPTTSSTLRTKLVQSEKLSPARSQSLPPLSLLLGIVALLGLGGGLLAYWLLPFGKPASITATSPSPSVALQPTPSSSASPLLLQASSQVVVRSPLPEPASPLILFSNTEPPEPLAVLPSGSVLRVLSTSGANDQKRWLQVQVCLAPEAAEVGSEAPPKTIVPPSPQPAQPTEPVDSPAPAAPDLAESPSPVEEVQPIAVPPPAQLGQTGRIEEANLLPWVSPTSASPTAPCSAPPGATSSPN